VRYDIYVVKRQKVKHNAGWAPEPAYLSSRSIQNMLLSLRIKSQRYKRGQRSKTKTNIVKSEKPKDLTLERKTMMMFLYYITAQT
jgi:hypothetical protein